MQNDVLKNIIAPNQEHNRWYKIKLKNSSNTWVPDQNECDLPNLQVTSSGTLTGVGYTLMFDEIDQIIEKYIASGTTPGTVTDRSVNRLRLHTSATSTGFMLSLNPATPVASEEAVIIFIHGKVIENYV